MRAQPRPGDFSRVWPLLAPGAQRQIALLITSLAQPSGVPRRVDRMEVIKLRDVIASARRLTAEQKRNLSALASCLEFHS